MEIRDQAERGSGISLKLFGFIAESVFTIIPESCSGSPRNSVRNHPGIAFTFDRIPHLALNRGGPVGAVSALVLNGRMATRAIRLETAGFPRLHSPVQRHA